MAAFNEAQLEQAFVELFKAEGYDYVHGENINRDTRDVILYDDLRTFLKEHHKEQGITADEINRAIAKIETTDGGGVYAENVEALRLIQRGFSLRRTDPKLPDLYINLINYDEFKTDEQTKGAKNIFKFVNQFAIDGEHHRIPDGIVFVNGLPLVVLEFKNAIKQNTTIENAYKQLTRRYRRDIPKLFRYNAFVVISDGVNNKMGSLFAPYEYFYGWNKAEATDSVLEGAFDSMFTMMHGLFRKERLIDVVHNFIYLPDTPKSEDKIVCRYPQYFATTALYENILRHSRLNPDGDGKGGTYFGATGCGKSYTMLFLAQQLMRSKRLSSPTIVLITDRTDLDNQLAKTFLNATKYIGDKTIAQANSREALGELLRGRAAGGVFLTTIQKFEEGMGLLSDRANIICISDEAHRSQAGLGMKTKITDKGVARKYGFAKYLRDSLPNATYVGFTGTPLDNTLDVFGPIVDRYTMTEAVADEITRKIVYEGRAAKVMIDSAKVKEIEKYYSECKDEGASEYQIEESKKRMTRIDVILNDPDLLANIAKDIVEHYERRVEEGSTVLGKAMIVCSSRGIAWNLYQAIIRIRPEWAEVKECVAGETLTDKEREQIKPMPRMAMVITRNKDEDSEELYNHLGNDEYRKTLDKQFKEEKSNFKIAIVVDMWITGFDVPSLDTMYCFKPLQMHTLIQTISRVNRVYPGKEKGLVVDYLGIKRQMNEALHQYGGNGDVDGPDLETIEEAVKVVRDELDIIRRMFNRFDWSIYFTGTPLQQLDVLNKAAEYVQKTKAEETRFMRHVKKMKGAYDICCNSDLLNDAEVNDLNFFLAIRSIISKLTKGNAPDAVRMNKRVAEMLKDALVSDTVEEIAKIGVASDEEIDLLSSEYMKRIDQIPYKNTKVKLMEQLLKQVIESLRKVNRQKGVDFTKRLEDIVKKYNDRSDDAALANDVIDDVVGEMVKLMEEVAGERKSGDAIGLSLAEKAFFDILKAVAVKYGFIENFPDEKLTELAKAIKTMVEEQSDVEDWLNRTDLRATLKMNVIVLLARAGYPPKIRDEVYKEILEQAENFKRHSSPRPYSTFSDDSISIAAEP
ncbi:MAG: type I restriction endonuclease subunit R [Muribaculaceae bacterium]|nr:type I restriction endonuclease subunit R [Muribaculaceae bacterium]